MKDKKKEEKRERADLQDYSITRSTTVFYNTDNSSLSSMYLYMMESVQINMTWDICECKYTAVAS